jgi:hypothetical protein
MANTLAGTPSGPFRKARAAHLIGSGDGSDPRNAVWPSGANATPGLAPPTFGRTLSAVEGGYYK